MAAYSQYSGSYGTVSSAIVNVMTANILPWEDYIIMQTYQNEYVCIIGKYSSGSFSDSKVIEVTRSTGTNNYFTVTRTEEQLSTVSYSREYYVYSNLGIGQRADLPMTRDMTCWGVLFILSIMVFSRAIRGLLHWRNSLRG